MTYYGATHRSDLEAALFDEGLEESRVQEIMAIHDRIVEDEKDLVYREESEARD